MKQYRIASPKLAGYSILYPLIPILLFWFFLCCTVDVGKEPRLVVQMAGCSVILIAFICYFRNAFCVYRISEKGISNRYQTMDWESITSYKIFSVDVYVLSRFRKTEIAEMCVFPMVESRSYRTLDPRECVFFEITPKALRLINRYCTHKTESIQELLDSYSCSQNQTMD